MNNLSVSNSRFSYPLTTLQQIARDILTYAKQGGATACETNVSDGFGQTVTVRQKAVETIEYNRDKGLSVTVYIGQKRGNASTTDFSPQAINDTVSAALSIARYTAEDDCAGLADATLLAQVFPDLDLYYPWILPVEEAIQLAGACEAAAYATDKRIINSEGASVALGESQFVYANSLGFMGGYPLSRHSISCAVIAGENNTMQRDYWYSVARDTVDLESAESIGRKAGARSVARLGAKKIATCEVPVLFEAPIASSLISHFVAAVSGGNLYRKSSFLLDSLDRQVFASDIQIRELPHIKKGLASSAFDDEGVATHPRHVVENGVVKGYFLGSYSARKLGLCSTGNAGGCHNLVLENAAPECFEALLKKMGTGLLVTELLGHGMNAVTGDYSRGASGYWVEGGEIRYPVEEITIAGNMKEMLLGIIAVGDDVVVHGSKQSGSILIERMTVAGG
ncbi:microcin-processing peptidase 1. Unknown type peptidase. MEROPS family U62 [Nitrosomonas cryotolerans]|uniref:PmbA protein n=1 Tax=Nitrosomonas cryotolerans ATCC 49181 TaxID=1131553 RepID=A0A1N6FDN6_9PROT|nr:metalloprotease PmbA [Nitrosomonas cryotolerans]SFQ00907.1 microcin-processing peptidase 1. Unknown type peptidase. MEROPS family U62 [Nitrosomonas cryotolerans]SIN93369.1 microcin-processing peptidase 1. Unknown type peptidase. MEROPS family U62 [Nitrosomonas cryotolerans ATCC 49181]